MSDALVTFALLAPLGFLVGVYGTIVGAGGGFILVPVLLVLLPRESPAVVTATSMAVVFFNAYSSTLTYARMRRIDYFAAVLFVIAAAPGAIVGSVMARHVPRSLFEPSFGVLMLALGLLLAAKPSATRVGGGERADRGYELRGQFNTLAGAVGTAYVGLFSTLFGIGGGVIHVPFLVRTLRFPPHVATATAQPVLAATSLVATITHLAFGSFDASDALDRTLCLAVGVMMGSPVGAMISARLRGSAIVRLLAVALCLAGLRLLAGQFVSLGDLV